MRNWKYLTICDINQSAVGAGKYGCHWTKWQDEPANKNALTSCWPLNISRHESETGGMQYVFLKSKSTTLSDVYMCE